MIQSNQSFLSRDIIFSLSHDIHVEMNNNVRTVKLCQDLFLYTHSFDKTF